MTDIVLHNPTLPGLWTDPGDLYDEISFQTEWSEPKPGEPLRRQGLLFGKGGIITELAKGVRDLVQGVVKTVAQLLRSPVGRAATAALIGFLTGGIGAAAATVGIRKLADALITTGGTPLAAHEADAVYRSGGHLFGRFGTGWLGWPETLHPDQAIQMGHAWVYLQGWPGWAPAQSVGHAVLTRHI